MRVLVLALLALAPVAAAHLEPYSQTAPIVVGPYSVLVEPFPQPVFANTAVMIRTLYTRVDTGNYVTNVTATLDVTYPNGTTETRPLDPDGRAYFTTQITVRERGEHALRVTARDDAGEWTNSTNLTVYPDASVRISPTEISSDPIAGQTYPVGVIVFDNVTRQVTDKLTDLTIRMEHWTDDHGTLLNSSEVPLNRTGAGRWSSEYTFPDKGMYHIRFASSSGGFNYDDIPLLHVYASAPPPPRPTSQSTGDKETPLGPAVALAGLALVALLRRR